MAPLILFRERAFITGLTGQDGQYLANLLLEKNYRVAGLIRRISTERDPVPDVEVVEGDIMEAARFVEKFRPHEVYHLAAQSHVGHSFQQPITTMQANATGTAVMLEAARSVCARFYQASTSELFGNAPAPQSEETPFHPRSPYACAKAAAYYLTRNYREAYGAFACNGVLFNHESPLRKGDFVTQKVVRGAVEIAEGRAEYLELGNLDAERDWGHARDYVRGMWLMLQQDKPDDYVLATGVSHSVKYLCEKTFDFLGLDWRDHVRVSDKYKRPCDVDKLCGDATKAREKLGWEPEISFDELIEEMIGACQSAGAVERKAGILRPDGGDNPGRQG